MSGVMHSALYQGVVRHRRFAPRAHAFEYRIGLLYLDLDEQDAVLGLSPLAGRGRLAPFAFRETDFLPDQTRAGQPLKRAVQQQAQTGQQHRAQRTTRSGMAMRAHDFTSALGWP